MARGALGLGGLAHAGMGGLRRAPTSARSCSCRSGLGAPAGDVLLVLAAGRAAVGVHRRDRRRDRLPARHLDGRLAAAGLARGLRGVARRRRPTCRRRPRCAAGIRFEHVSFAYPGTDRLVLDDVSARRCPPARSSPSSARTAPARPRWSSCSRRCTSRRRVASCVDDTPLARMPADAWRDAPGRRVPGLLPLRVPGPAHGRPRRRAAPRRRARRGHRRRRAPAPTTSSRGCRGARHAARADLARRRRGRRSASGRSSRWRAASCATSRCCWCSTSRPPRSTPRPSTRCSSATPPRPREARSAAARITHPGVAPLLDRADGRSHRRPRRRAAGRGRHARGADGEAGSVRGAVSIQAAAYAR